MTGVEPLTSDIESDRSANWVTAVDCKNTTIVNSTVIFCIVPIKTSVQVFNFIEILLTIKQPYA